MIACHLLGQTRFSLSFYFYTLDFIDIEAR